MQRSLFDKKIQDQLTKLFYQYLSEGGFPEVIEYDPNVRQQTLQEYIDIVLYRDVIERYNIKNPSLIKYMILSIIHNISNPFSINKFYNDLKNKGYKTGKDILYDYMDYIEDSYLAFFVPFYSKSIRKIQANPKKVYAIDSGIIRALTLDYEKDLGKLFENIVYLDLKRLGYQVHYYLTSERYEINFLVTFPRGEKKLYQVAWDTENEKILEREERALGIAMKELGIDGKLVTLESYLQEGIS